MRRNCANRPPQDAVVSGHHPQPALRIGLDARSLVAARPRGTGRNLTDAYRLIPQLRPDWEFVLYHRQGAAVALDGVTAPHVRTRPVHMPGDRWDAWFQLGLPLAAWRDGVDVLHLPANAAPAWCPVPCVTTIHDLVPLRVADEAAPAVRRGCERGVRRAVRRSRRLICPSAVTRDELVTTFGADAQRVTVVPWAADRALLTALADEAGLARDVARVRAAYGLTRPWLLNFSGRSRRKNAAGVVAAVAALPAAVRREICVLLVGCEPDEYRATLAEQAAAAGVADAVRVSGFVPHGDLPGLLAGARGLLMPSLCEGFGLPILDAFAAGVPVLTAALSSMPEVAGEAAEYCDPHAPASIAAGIARLLEPRRADDLRARGRARLARFTWERTAQLMVEVYARAAGGACGETAVGAPATAASDDVAPVPTRCA